VEPERWRQVEELYHASLKVAADERPGFLKSACRDDVALYQEVESLLSYEEPAEEFIKAPAFEVQPG